MNRKKRNQKKAKTRINPNDYEGYQYGPLTLERAGRFVQIGSNWKAGEHEQYLKDIKANQPSFKQEINAKIQELIAIVEEFSPLELLAAFAPPNVFADAETLKESTHEGKESYVEYAQSIALSVKNPRIDNHATEEAIDKFKALIAEIFNDTVWYFSVDNMKYERTKGEIRHKSLLHYLMVRGDSYPQHHIELVKDLFEPHDSFFKEKYGFTINDFIKWIQNIETETLEAMKRYGRLSEQMHELHQLFLKFVEDRKEDSISSMEELMKLFNSLPEVKIKRTEIENSYEELDYIMFEVKPSKKIPKQFLDLVSSKFGDNENFTSFEKSPGWITNDSVIYRRPIIFHEDKYYCFGVQFLYRNLISILGALIKEKDVNYFEEKYQKTRGKFLVDKSLEYLQNILPEAKIYKELHYEIEGKRVETDGIIIFDNSIFIVEGKAGSLTIPARRGALARIEHDVTHLVDDAYKQAIRTKKFINETTKPRFEYENGTEALVIEDKSQFKNIYLLNLTIENLGHLSSDLNNLKKLNLLKGKEWIWSVFLNDLKIISEIVETPSEFLVYLQRRLKANDHPQFNTADELDFFMYYLNDGLYFENNWLKNYDVFTPHAYTDSLDRYYNFKAGIVSSGDKPRLKIPEEYKKLVQKIESTKKRGFSDVTTSLLSFSVDSMEEILKNIERAKTLSLSDVRDHDFSMTFNSPNLGLTVAVISKDSGRTMESVSDYCELKMYQLKFNKWIFLAIDIESSEEKIDFKVFEKEWKFDKAKETELNVFRNNRLQHHLISNEKPKPNDPCPCNSGKKFKKCCAYKFR